MQITFTAHRLNGTESRALRPLRLSERPLTTGDIVRIARLTERQAMRVLARLMDLGLIDQAVGGFIPTDTGRAAILSR